MNTFFILINMTGSHKADSFPSHVSFHKGKDDTSKATSHGHGHGHEHAPRDPDAMKIRFKSFDGLTLPHLQTVITAIDLSPYKTMVDLGGSFTYIINGDST